MWWQACDELGQAYAEARRVLADKQSQRQMAEWRQQRKQKEQEKKERQQRQQEQKHIEEFEEFEQQYEEEQAWGWEEARQCEKEEHWRKIYLDQQKQDQMFAAYEAKEKEEAFRKLLLDRLDAIYAQPDLQKSIDELRDRISELEYRRD